MSVRRIAEPALMMDAEERFEGFETLMPFKVHNILLVSSLYDSFILREDGRLNELLIDQSLELSPEQFPESHMFHPARKRPSWPGRSQFNLIVTNLAVGDMNAAQLASEVKQAGLDVPVVVLGYDYREIKNFVARNPVTDIERIFLWQGNARILIAIVKYIEDQAQRAARYSRHGGAGAAGGGRQYPLLLLVSAGDLYRADQAIAARHSGRRQRGAQTGAHAGAAKDSAEHRISKTRPASCRSIAIIFSGWFRTWSFRGRANSVRKRALNWRAWSKAWCRMCRLFCKPAAPSFVRARTPTDIRFCASVRPHCCKTCAGFLTEQFGFGDFVFRLPDGSEVGRAKDMNELEEQLQTVPAESLVFHSQSNHFSHWLMARTEFALAAKLRPRKVSDFASAEHLRRDLIESINDYRREQSEVLIGDFRADTFKPSDIEFSAYWFRFARRQSSRPGVCALFVAQEPHDPPLSRRSHLGASRGCSRDRHVRSIRDREQSSRLCLALRR